MPDTYDAIVVGAGYIGCSVAYHLAASGLKTAIFDRGSLAAGASRANYGNIQIQDMELNKSVEMINLARTRFSTLEQELDWKVGLRKVGSLLPIETENQQVILAHRMKVLQSIGIDSEIIPAERLTEVEPAIDPIRLLGGLYHAGEGQLDPFQLIWAYLLRARKKGLQEFYYTEVTGFNVEKGRLIGIRTSIGNFSAGCLVLCTGAHTQRFGKMLGRDWGVRYVLGQAAATEPVGQVLQNHIASASFFEESAEIGKGNVLANLAISQSAHGNLLLGEAMYTADHYLTGVPVQSIPGIAACTLRYFPSFQKLRILRSWSAAVADTGDGLPVFGPVEGIQGLYIAAAFRSTVIITPLAGETIAQLITNGTCELDISHFLPERNANGYETY
jgi:sarcosine oxidase, subunit beta